jgi:hypothetical protein
MVDVQRESDIIQEEEHGERRAGGNREFAHPGLANEFKERQWHVASMAVSQVRKYTQTNPYSQDQ